MNQTTYQEIFDKALKSLREQRRPSVVQKVPISGRAACLYRNVLDGTKCAVGHLIPEELYDPSFEGRRPSNCGPGGDITRAVGLDPNDRRDVEFLRDLQECHDGPVLSESEQWMKAFEANMATVAEVYGLDYQKETTK